MTGTPIQFDRRDALKLTGAGVLAAWSGTLASPRASLAAAPARPVPARSVRLAHMTDIHVQHERRADEGLTACLEHASRLERKPDMIVTGGDLVFDSYDQNRARTEDLWSIHTRLFKDHAAVPVVHTIGNHDIWGWNKKESKTAGDEPGWGKRRFCEMAGREKTYNAFDLGGEGGLWRVIQLDSIQHHPGDPSGYIGKLDAEQMAWLEGEVKGLAAGRYAVIVSHIPILSLCATVFDGHAREKDSRWEVPAGNMHIDGGKLHRLFAANAGKVKLCLSGHIHKTDRVEMDGVTYICNGAVCGAWWQGKKDRCDEGYGVVDLFDDGSFKNEYVKYGWKAEG